MLWQIAAIAGTFIGDAVLSSTAPPLPAQGASCAVDSGECELEPVALLQAHGRRGVAEHGLSSTTMSVEALPPEEAAATGPPSTSAINKDLHTKPVDWSSTASQLVGVQSNGVGDLYSFLCNLATNLILIAISLAGFCYVRHRYPLIYSNNVLIGKAAKYLHFDTFFGWFWASLSLTPEEVEQSAGLDALMLLEFCKLCIQILMVIGVPCLAILGPLHMTAGGGEHVDRLSRLGLGNLPKGHWLCWPHAALVWYVVVTTEYFVLRAQRMFVERRFAWLRAMPAPRSTTVLVQRIPPEFCSDGALQRKFEELFGKDHVEAAVIVKETRQLVGLMAAEAAADQALHQAEFQWEKDGKDEDRRPFFHNLFGERKDSMDYYKALKQEAADAIAVERHRLSSSDEVNSSSGFVTFTSRRDQELALMANIAFDPDEFVVHLPPDPADVMYADLAEDPRKQFGRAILGHACIVGLYLGFMPFVVGVSQLTNLHKLAQRFTLVRQFLLKFPSLAPLLNSLAPVLALKFFMMFLPTFLMVIYRSFFCLRAEAWAQHKLQSSYFWFLTIFEILVTSVGSSLTHTTKRLIRHPLSICTLMADTLPGASHFYLNFMVFNWGTHVMNLTRYLNLFKFLVLRSLCKEERARELSEPEDQDWYGYGGRSARFTETMVVGLIFCSISPLITLLTLINFCICRVVYGYLLVFAETRKPDLGGYFWVRQLDHLQKGLLIYILTMIGVLFRMGHTRHPAFVAFGSLLCWVLGYRKLHSIRWQSLPLQELNDSDCSSQLRKSSRTTYVQPELSLKCLPTSDAD